MKKETGTSKDSKMLELALWQCLTLNTYLQKNNIELLGNAKNLQHQLTPAIGINLLNSFFNNCISTKETDNKIIGRAIMFRKAIKKISYLRKELFNIIELNKDKQTDSEVVNRLANALNTTPLTSDEAALLEYELLFCIHGFYNDEFNQVTALILDDQLKILKGKISYHGYMLVNLGRASNDKDLIIDLFAKQLTTIKLLEKVKDEPLTEDKKTILKYLHWIPNDIVETQKTIEKIMTISSSFV